jgi:hypothetical protein
MRVAHVGENGNIQRILVRQPETIHLVDLGIDGKVSQMDLEEDGKEGMDWIHPAQDRDK